MINEAALGINIILLLVLIFLVVKNQMNNKKNSSQVTPTPPSPQPQSPEWALKEAQDLIHDASKKADAIISQAEVEGIKIAAEEDLGSKIFENDAQQKIQNSLTEVEKKYLTELDKLLVAHRDFLAKLQQRSNTAELDTENMMKSRVNELLFSLEQNLTSFLSTSEQKSLESINLELKSARQLIDTYRTQQLSLIDENIVAVLERTISLVMKEQISLRDQLDLVYEALEKAKAEKFFA